VPLTGLIWSIGALKLGNVTIKSSTDNEIAGLKQIISVLSRNWPSEQQTDQALQHSYDLIDKALKDKVCAQYMVIAEPVRAAERAQLEARRAVELLTLACAARFGHTTQGNTVVSLEGESLSQGPLTTITTEAEITTMQTAPFTTMPMFVTDESIPGLQQIGVFTLSDWLAKGTHDLTDLQRSLLRATHWFATAQAQVEYENRLLNLITALETIFVPKSMISTSSLVAEGAALLLGATYEERKDIRRFLLDMYKARSSVSHGGKKAVFESEVQRVRTLTADLILLLTRSNDTLSTHFALDEWLERRRLGGD